MSKRPSRPPLVGSPEIAQQRVQQLLDKERDPVPPVLRFGSIGECTVTMMAKTGTTDRVESCRRKASIDRIIRHTPRGGPYSLAH